MRLRTAALALVVLGFAAGARADDEGVARARTHYKAGEALYNLHNYTDAIREFSAGYALTPLPAFLLNLGQAYRMRDKDDDLERAREMYRKYLAAVGREDWQRANVTQVLAEIEAKIAARPAPAPAPPPEVKPAPQPVPAAALTQEAGPPGIDLRGESPRPSVEKKGSKAGVVVVVLLAAVAAAVGVTLGVYFGTRGSGVDCGAVSLGCIDASR